MIFIPEKKKVNYYIKATISAEILEDLIKVALEDF
jgi:hypothetical protein